MGSVGSRRTARGFAALKVRYVRRGEFLCRDRDFHAIIDKFQRRWREHRPEFPLHSLCNDEPLLFPWFRRDGDYETCEILPANYVPPRFVDAVDDWDLSARNITQLAFPRIDFYSTAPPSRTRGMAFIRACMTGDPRQLIGRVEKYFPLERLELTMDLSGYQEYGIEPEEWEYDHPAQAWYVPVYPGMTAKDLEAAIPAIIEQVNYRLGPRTVGARIEALSADGHTQQAIADMLGLDVKSVGAHLTAANQSSLPIA